LYAGCSNREGGEAQEEDGGMARRHPLAYETTDLAVASQKPGEFAPAVTDQVVSDMVKPVILGRTVLCGGGGKFEHPFRDGLFREMRFPRRLFDGLAVFVAGLEIHLRVDAGWILLQQVFDPAGLLEDFSPIHQRELPQAGKHISDGYLVLGLPVLFAEGQFAQRLDQDALEPILHQYQRVRLVVEVADKLGTEILAGGGKVFG